jgi:hypothetical protein
MNEQREAVFLFDPARGETTAMRKRLKAAIRSVVGRTRAVGYSSARACDGGSPRFTVAVTDAEFSAVLAQLDADDPVDAYHD